MLLNEFLKEHQKVEQLEAEQKKSQSAAAQQQKPIDALTARLQALKNQLQNTDQK